MTFWPVSEYNTAVGELPIPPVTLLQGGLISGTSAVGMMPAVGEIGMEAFVSDVDVSSEGKGVGDIGGNRYSRQQ